MATFTHSFTVNRPQAAVARFHQDPAVLQRLSPPPIFIQLHRVEPLSEGAISEFTMWIGPIPVYWIARHENVSPAGFRDEQIVGPLAHWRHTHRFVALEPGRTRIEDHITYGHPAGWRGWLTRLLFSRPGLTVVFTYRRLYTMRALRGEMTE